MSDLDETPKHEPRPTGIGPGERLQAARIQQGLSLEDVARRMHLSSNILGAIEDNNFEEITAPIFVKGYLRAYARIVTLDEDDMIQQYMDFYSEEDPPITTTSNMAPELSVTDTRVKGTTYLVIVVVLTLLAAWWWNKEQNDAAPISLDAQSTDSAQQNTAAADVVDSEIEAASENMTESPDSTVAMTAEQSVMEETLVESDEMESVAPETTAPVVDTAVAENDTQMAATTVTKTNLVVTEPGPTAALTPSLIAPSGSDKLEVIVHADTWADIKDSSDYQLVYDLLRADQSVQLTGAAPFTVFLGNGHGVEIIFNGVEIEVAPRVRDDNTARLKIR